MLGTFALQMAVGAAVGVGAAGCCGRACAGPLPSEALYPLRTLAIAVVLYGAATVAHGSGFLAVFVAGILLGDGAHRSSATSSGSTPRWPGWPRSWRSSCSG